MYQVNKKEDIEALGFKYSEDGDKCRLHMLNDIPIDFDMSNVPDSMLEDIDKDLNRMFSEILKWELKDAGIKRVREISWDRIFFFPNYWEPRLFTAKYWVRVLSEDGGKKKTYPNVCRA